MHTLQSSRCDSNGLLCFITTASHMVRVDCKKMIIVPEHKSCWHYPSVYHGTNSYLRTCGISCCFSHQYVSHSILKSISPHLTIIMHMAPSHFASSNNDILWNLTWLQLYVKLSTFMRGHMKQSQQESSYGPCAYTTNAINELVNWLLSQFSFFWLCLESNLTPCSYSIDCSN